MAAGFAWEKVRLLEKPEELTHDIYASKDGIATSAFITCEGRCRYRLDGVNPTSEDGHLLNDDNFITLTGDLQIKNFRAVNVGDSFTMLQVTYMRG